jgi:hypothetical protein
MNLFVIGNGFDMHLHHLPTSYSDFRDFLIEKYPGCDEYDDLIPVSRLMPDGSEKYNIDDVAGYITRILDDCKGGDWKNLESYLGNEVFDSFLNDLDYVDMDTSDKETYQAAQRNEELSEHIKLVFVKAKSLFCDWVRERLGALDFTGKHNDIAASVLAEGDKFLNFNYTKTLETLYGISNICHIHGVVGDPEEDIFFGHGDVDDIPESMESLGADWNLNELKIDLRKNTEAALHKHWDFFEGLHGVRSIHSFGFSFSPVDMVYIQEIARRAKGVTWYLDEYANGHTESRSILKRLGFKVEVEHRW